MAPPNIPADFDFLDPDVNLAGLPVEELAELRKSEPDPLGRHPGRHGRLRGQRLLDRHQARGRQGGVAPQRRLLQLAERRHPDLAAGDEAGAGRAAAQRHAEHGRTAPHPAAQDHLPRVHATGHRAAGGRTRPARPEHRQSRGGRGLRRLRRAGVVRAAAASHRRPARRSPGGPRQALPLVQRDDRRHRPRVRRRRSRAVVDGTDHVRHGDGRGAGQEPHRRHRHHARSRPTSTARSSPTTSSASS